MGFFEVFWDGEAIGDGSDLEEALTAYLSVQPEDSSWAEACAAGRPSTTSWRSAIASSTPEVPADKATSPRALGLVEGSIRLADQVGFG